MEIRKAPRAAAVACAVSCLCALIAPACSSKNSANSALTAPCSLSSDCSAGLVCALGRCRTPCVTAVDCGNGGSCITDGRSAVCQPAPEKNMPCDRLTDCPVPLACASDYRCRNLCATDGDCNILGITGRVCAKDANGVLYCADPPEVSNGAIVAQPPAGHPTTPVVEPDAGATMAGADGSMLDATMAGADGSMPDATMSGGDASAGDGGFNSGKGDAGDAAVDAEAGGSSPEGGGTTGWKLWVSTGNGHIYGYDPGQLAASNGDPPTIDLSLSNGSIAIPWFDSTGNLWGTSNRALVKFAPAQLAQTGRIDPVLSVADGTGNYVFSSFAFDPSGNVWAANSSSQSVGRIDAAHIGAAVGNLSYSYSVTDAANTLPVTFRLTWVFASLTNLIFDSSGNLFGFDQGQFPFRFDATQLVGTGATSQKPALMSGIGYINGFGYAQNLLWDAMGRLWVGGSRIARYATADLLRTGQNLAIAPEALFAVSDTSLTPNCLAFDPSGNLWVGANQDYFVKLDASAVAAVGLSDGGAITVSSSVTIRTPVSNPGQPLCPFAAH
jgi:ligand-binding sensor domain-containing protein